MSVKSVPYDVGMADLYKQHPEIAVEMLSSCLVEGNQEMLLVTLHQLATAAWLQEKPFGDTSA